jgi:hypothetical protein
MRVAARATFFRVADFQSLWFIFAGTPPAAVVDRRPHRSKSRLYDGRFSRRQSLPQPWVSRLWRAERESRKLCRMSTAAT